MKRITLILSWALLALLLAACGTAPVGRKFEFDANKDYGLVAYEMYFIAETTPHFDMYLFPYDPETKTIDAEKRVTTGCGFYCSRNNEGAEVYINTIYPGSYVIGYLFYAEQFNSSILCYADETVQIDIEAGKVHYLGEINITPSYPNGLNQTRLEVVPHSEAHVRARLEKFPTVLQVDPYFRPDGKRRKVKKEDPSADLVVVPIKYVSFERGEITREGACVRGYLD